MEEINKDELTGFIMRRAYEKNVHLDYEQVKTVLEGETDFLYGKGIIHNENSPDGAENASDKEKTAYFG